MYTIPELLANLPTIQYDDRIFFKDENYNQWYVQVEENWDDDDEEYFRARKNSALGQLLSVRPSFG